jgi:hypothetical protein
MNHAFLSHALHVYSTSNPFGIGTRELMALFIHSKLHSLNVHKRLTELERLSEITTGLFALKGLINQGGKPRDLNLTLDTLERLSAILPEAQREYIIQELISPMLQGQEIHPDALQDVSNAQTTMEEEHLASSDYEMEYQLTLSRGQKTSILKDPLKIQYQARKDEYLAQNNENKAEELKRHSEEIKAQRIEAINEKWQEVKAMRGGPHFAMHLLVFIGNYTNETLKDQPSVIEARSCYQDLLKSSKT